MVGNALHAKNRTLLFLIIIVILSVSLFFIYSTPTRSQDATEITPTVFVHGFKGGPGSFDTMLERFERNKWGSKRMIFYVSAKGKLSTYGSDLEARNPYIQILFENNRASLENQTAWLQKIMKTIHEAYDIKQVNLVGHSMGGLTATNFLLHNQEDVYPRVEKLVVMGSPFKGINNEHYFELNTGAATLDLQAQSQTLQSMVKNKNNFDDHTEVLAIAGVINNRDKSLKQNSSNADQVHSQKDMQDSDQVKPIASGSDGLVNLGSALGIKDIVPFHKYNQQIFYDKTATHSGLHENTDVDKKVASFLWNIQSK